jgi:hypothetical protein
MPGIVSMNIRIQSSSPLPANKVADGHRRKSYGVISSSVFPGRRIGTLHFAYDGNGRLLSRRKGGGGHICRADLTVRERMDRLDKISAKLIHPVNLVNPVQ